MEKHTPGPWKEKHGQDVMVDEGPCSRLIAECHAGHREERLANARLIAAAPDMASALKKCISLLYHFQGKVERPLPVPCQEIQEAESALEKAGLLD